MTPPGPADLLPRADELASAGRWEALFDLLSGAEDGAVLSRPRLAYRYGEALYHTARFRRLGRFAERFEAQARDAADVAALLRALNLRFIAAFETGRIDAARATAETLLELASAEDDEEMQARSANNMGLILSLEGAWEEALSYFQLALPLYERLGVTRGLSQVHQNLGNVYRFLDRLDEAVEEHRRAASLSRGIDYPFGVAMASVGRAEVELLRGQPAYARELAMQGTEKARAVGDPLTEADGLRVLALAERESGDPGEALEHLARALERATGAGNRLLEAEIRRDRARVLADAGETSEARREIQAAIGGFEDTGATYEAKRSRELRDAL